MRESQQRMKEAEAVRQAEARVREEMAARIPVSPPESALWMNRMMAEMWLPFFVPMALADNLANWQVRRWKTCGWDLLPSRIGPHAMHLLPCTVQVGMCA